jgi:very-short-patch-repair endonuclease
MRAPILTFKRARKLRRSLTAPEVIPWQHPRGSRLEGLRFRRQHPMGPYILDFFCATARLAIEIDGAIHGTADQARHDQNRDRWLHQQGIKVLRIPAADILDERKLLDLLAGIQRMAAPSPVKTRGRKQRSSRDSFFTAP